MEYMAFGLLQCLMSFRDTHERKPYAHRYIPHTKGAIGCILLLSRTSYKTSIRFATDLKLYDTHVLSQQGRVSIYILPLWGDLNCTVETLYNTTNLC